MGELRLLPSHTSAAVCGSFLPLCAPGQLGMLGLFLKLTFCSFQAGPQYSVWLQVLLSR